MSTLTLADFGVKPEPGVEYFLTIPVDGNEVFGEKVELVEEIGDSLVMPLNNFIAFANQNLDECIQRGIDHIRNYGSVAPISRNTPTVTSVRSPDQQVMHVSV